jgi:hypothetical protein
LELDFGLLAGIVDWDKTHCSHCTLVHPVPERIGGVQVVALDRMPADVVVAYYKGSAVLGGLPENMDQDGKAQPAVVHRSPPVAAYAAAGRDPGGAVEDMASALGEGTVEEQVAHMGLVARTVAHSKGRLEVARSHSPDLVEALVHSLGRMARVDAGHIGCIPEAWEALDNRMGDNHSAGQIAVVGGNHTGLGEIAGEAFRCNLEAHHMVDAGLMVVQIWSRLDLELDI